MPPNNDQNQEKESPQRFFKLLEAGDLAFLELMEYAFVIFGVTKHGKTTLSHHLINNPLRAYLNERKQVHYKLNNEKLADAKIGSKLQSQTEIPNKFQTKIKIGSDTVHLIDNPGQLDSFGINRVLSNAYFHYRVFSKVKNMKFMIVFDINTFSTNVKEINAIFQLFFQSFVNFKSIESQILKSIAIVFTKVKKETSLADLRSIITAYQQTFNKTVGFSNQEKQFLSKLFKQCKQNDKIKIFRQAVLDQDVGNCEILTELHQKLQFFSRKIDDSQRFNSLYFNEKRVEMSQIKFSQNKTVSKLAVMDFQNEQIHKLFQELSSRGNNMFGLFFNFIQNLFQFLIFQYDKSQNVERSIDKSELLRETRRQKLRNILLELQKKPIFYKDEEKYNKTRQLIIGKYKQKLSKSTKIQIFVDVLDLSMKLSEFCNKFSGNPFINKNPEQILACKQEVQKIFLQISALYSTSEQIDKLSRFLYNINTFLNQLIIFSQIILPSEKEGQQKVKSFLSHQPFDKFLSCLSFFANQTTKANEFIISKIQSEFYLERKKAQEINTQQLIILTLDKKSSMLSNQRENNELLLERLSQMNLSQQMKIQCVFLMFNTLKEQYSSFIHFKKIINKNKAKDSTIQIHQQFNPKDVKTMIFSFLNILKQLKKVKDLFCFKIYKKFQANAHQIGIMCWNYLVNLFLELIKCEKNAIKRKNQQQQAQRQKQRMKKNDQPGKAQRQNNQMRDQTMKKVTSPKSKNRLSSSNLSKQSQKSIPIDQNSPFYHDIIIEILSSHPHVSFIESTFDRILAFELENFNQITPQKCANLINKKSGKNLQGYETDCMAFFEQQKKLSSSKIINNLLKQASILKNLDTQDIALIKCHEAFKYLQFCPQKLEQIQDKIDEIQSQKILSGQWVRQFQNHKKTNQFEPSLTTKRQLTKFTLQNPDAGLLNFVKIDFFKK